MDFSRSDIPQSTFSFAREHQRTMPPSITSTFDIDDKNAQVMAVNQEYQQQPNSSRPYRSCKRSGDADFEIQSSPMQPDTSSNNGALLNNSRLTAKTSPENPKQGSYSLKLASSNRLSISRHRPPDNRKRSRSDDEDELLEPPKHARMTLSMEKWELCLISELANNNPEVLCRLFDSGRSEIRERSNQIGSLKTAIQLERGIYKQKEQSLNERYETLNKNFKTLKMDVAFPLMANIEDFSIKVSDDTIRREWGQLCYKIKNIVSNYLVVKPQAEATMLHELRYGQRTQLMTTAEEIILLRDSIFRRQLWHVIYFCVFSGNEMSWCGKIGRAFAHHIAQLDPRSLPSLQYLEMVSKMKSVFEPNLEEERMPRDAELRSMILDTVTYFQHFIPSMRMDSFQMRLQDIFSDAIKTHTTMLKSKAIFVVRWTGDDNGETLCTYDPETMTPFQDGINTSSSYYAVQLIESPAVWKIGTAEGKNLDSAMVLVQSSVVLGGNLATEVLEKDDTI